MSSKKESLIYTVKILIVCMLFSIILYLLYILFGYAIPMHMSIADAGGVPSMGTSVVLDAGHGGRDGGAVSKSGIPEKDLNFAVTNVLYDILTLCGTDTVMTRTEDSLVCDENDPALKGKLKMTDLKNRLAIAEKEPNSVFVSIHMNNFPIEKYSGLQVYYSPNHAASLDLAETVQDKVREALQPNNDRKVKPAGSNIFLLDRISTPAVLVECGFLSNPAEAQKLTDKIYQTQLALVLADSILLNLTQVGNN